MGDESATDFRTYRKRELGIPDSRQPNRPQLDRVRGKIGPGIEAFFRDHRGQEFYAADVLAYLAARDIPCAPASADRVMRDLRASGKIMYVVVDKSRSLYRIPS